MHLKIKSTWTLKPLYDVIATIPGSTEPDQWVMRGNHHDAWVNGAEDPIAGLVPELEEARALGVLLKQGWHPKRTIIYAAWDGEEPGLLGSTEWAETHADELRTKGVAYLNTDTNDRGYLGMEGSHVLEKFINGVARDIDDPETHLSVWKRLQAAVIQNGTPDERKDARDRADLRIGALGSGSDFTPFLQHLGVPSLNLGYGGEDDGGIYHSIYDDFYWYTHFSDTSFVYGRALAQTVGTALDAPRRRGRAAVRLRESRRDDSHATSTSSRSWRREQRMPLASATSSSRRGASPRRTIRARRRSRHPRCRCRRTSRSRRSRTRRTR